MPLRFFDASAEIGIQPANIENAHTCPGCGYESLTPLSGTFSTSSSCCVCGHGQEHLMRHLPCSRCGVAKTADGAAYLMGGSPLVFPFTYQCASCKTVNRLGADDFHMLPLLGPAEYKHLLPLAKDAAPSGSEVRQRFIPVKDPDPVKRLGRLLVRAEDKAHKIPVRRIDAADARKNVPRG